MSGEYLLDTPAVRGFLAAPQEACEAIRPGFAAPLADPDWLSPV